MYDNQGLVRRMYGDMRHIFVMQSELENEVDFNDMHDSADKYSKAFNSHNQRQMKAKKVAVDRKNFRSDSEPYFRPAQRTSTVNTKLKMRPPKVPATEQVDSNSLVDNMIKSNVEALEQELKVKEENLLESSTKTTSTSTTSSNVPTIDDEQLIASALNKNDATTIDKVVLNLFNNISSALSTSTTTLPSTLKTSDLLSTPDEDANIVKLSSTLKNESVIKLEAELEEEVFNDLEQLASGVAGTSTENVDSMDNSKEPQTTTTETQLFQDTLQREKEPTPIVNRRGV